VSDEVQVLSTGGVVVTQASHVSILTYTCPLPDTCY